MYNFEFLVLMENILIINGPNLNLLGKREPSIYGSTTFEEYLKFLKGLFPSSKIEYFQSNIEGELISKLQENGFGNTKILLNAGGYTHTSVAIADAVAAISTEVLEIHISQPAAREVERHSSLLSKYCKGSISGLGLDSYKYGIQFFLDHAKT